MSSYKPSPWEKTDEVRRCERLMSGTGVRKAYALLNRLKTLRELKLDVARTGSVFSRSGEVPSRVASFQTHAPPDLKALLSDDFLAEVESTAASAYFSQKYASYLLEQLDKALEEINRLQPNNKEHAREETSTTPF